MKALKNQNLIFIIVVLFLFLFVLGINIFINNEQKRKEQASLLTGKHDIEIVVKDYGVITLELDADIAPITVTNFIHLVNEKFYDGLTFHRIMDGFMIQGGDPNGNGTGGSGKTIKGEFSANGIENNISHKRGVISMARGQAMNSASSQFFIVQEDSTNLDGNYAAFGHVIEGMDVVDKIVEEVKVEEDGETVLPENQPMITSIRELTLPTAHETEKTDGQE